MQIQPLHSQTSRECRSPLRIGAVRRGTLDRPEHPSLHLDSFKSTPARVGTCLCMGGDLRYVVHRRNRRRRSTIIVVTGSGWICVAWSDRELPA
ncbi:hypothetical protein AVEN_115029-1 [Araneus ventricosus]|uniref:Uncharacterized protein n=1 Tax=Araneus ventricosus TaxID=182803 RepID=A0A4Y1ZX70_ARAVE|nr:hypothetical protein AVEN_115029-1 [Araneus ventricosus]